ncbi:hypothetical protein F5Y12DRAFT_718076 [Xylaria sp. FL1777]|nr:hypothetical protein F5Y12DRAFT_718076 [Xylaria sp. FL1777]
MALPESRSSSRASWMFTDPYVYKYSDVDVEDNIPLISPGQQSVIVDSTPCELEGSAPTDTIRYELAAKPLVASIRDSHQTSDEPPKSPCGLSRSRFSNAHKSLRYPDRRGHTRVISLHTSPAPYSNPGLIPVVEDASTPVQHYVPDTAAPPRYVRPSPPAYADGLIPLDDNATTPKEPSSDFDAILRNIGPISKKGKGKTGRERSSRYYDRYSSNFG